MKNRRVIVTGGLGFIGSHMAERLIRDNEVTVVDDGSTGRLDNVRHLLPEGLAFVEGNVADLDLAKVFEGKDYVFHLAALPSVPRSIRDPMRTHQANLTGTLNVLVAAKDAGIKKVVFASSSSVYGDTPTLPKSEDMSLNPKSPYAVTKAAGEMYCRVFGEIYGIRTVSLRYFNVFGPRQDPGSPYAAVVPLFIRAVMDGKSPVVFGDGEQSRDFTYVRNVVDASMKACESDMTGTFNVACGRSVTINRLVGLINELLGKDIRPVYVPPRPGDIKHSLADISQAGRFSYAPSGDFREELKETIRSFGTCLN
jgi:UDP-glucose 4-epimerase